MSRSAAMTADSAITVSSWRSIAAALASTVLALGLARFAFAPMVPALVAAHWFDPGQASYLGAINFAGYVIGVATAQKAARHFAPADILRVSMALIALSFAACSVPLSFSWFAFWRALAGLTGGLIMVLAATLVLNHVPVQRRGLASGAIFSGIGFGIVANALLTPALLNLGMSFAWGGLALLSALLTAVSWSQWPRDPGAAGQPLPALDGSLRILPVIYGLNAIGIVPHTIYLVDLVSRQLGFGIAAGAAVWLAFGLGAVMGSILIGRAGDLFGFKPVLRSILLAQAILVTLTAVSADPLAIGFAALLMGGCAAGSVGAVLGRVREKLPDQLYAQRALWSRATVGFAVAQMGAGFLLSKLLGSVDGYQPLFLIGAAAVSLAFLLSLWRG